MFDKHRNGKKAFKHAGFRKSVKTSSFWLPSRNPHEPAAGHLPQRLFRVRAARRQKGSHSIYAFRFSSCHMPRDCDQNVDIDTINHPSLRVTPSASRSAGQSPKLCYIGLNALANNKDDIVIRQTFLSCICLSIDHSLQQESITNCHSRQIILIHMNCHQILAKEHACLHVHSYLKAKQSFN